VNLLGFSATANPEDRDLLVDLLNPQIPIGLQQAAIASLGRSADPKVPEMLLRGWKTYSPQVKGAILDIMQSRKAWTASLLSSLEGASVPPAEIDPPHRSALLTHRDQDLRKQAEAIFAQQATTRQKVIDAYKPALGLKGDPAAGKAVFKKVCATCHRLGDVGLDVGPNLGALNEKNPETLLIAILDPNRAFESRYANFSVATVDGRVLTGLIASETASAVTLRRQDAKEDVLLRTEIEEMAASGQSLMPEGLEKDLPQRDMVDLIAFLEGIGPPPKTLPGNHPSRVKAGPDGTIVLGAADAEIYGDRLAYETQYGNLGYWTAANDRAAWSFEVSHPGRYAVWLEMACPNESAGNVLEVNLGNQQIRYKVSGTGSWDYYTLKRIGDVELSEGTLRLEVRPAAPPRNALLDLRRIELRPRTPIPVPALKPKSASTATSTPTTILTTQTPEADRCSCSPDHREN
jgi:putative heme-binding domain-containing protein